MDIHHKIKLIKEGFNPFDEINNESINNLEKITEVDELSLFVESIDNDIEFLNETWIIPINEGAQTLLEYIKKFFQWIKKKIDQFFNFIKSKLNELKEDMDLKAYFIKNGISENDMIKLVDKYQHKLKNYYITFYDKAFNGNTASILPMTINKIYGAFDYVAKNIIDSDLEDLDIKENRNVAEITNAVFNKIFKTDYTYENMVENIYGKKTNYQINVDNFKSLLNSFKNMTGIQSEFERHKTYLRGLYDNYERALINRVNREISNNKEYNVKINGLTQIFSATLKLERDICGAHVEITKQLKHDLEKLLKKILHLKSDLQVQ